MNLMRQNFVSVLFVAVSLDPRTGPGTQFVLNTCVKWKDHRFPLCLGLHRQSYGMGVETQDTKQVVT